MSVSFTRTLRSIREDDTRLSTTAFACAVLVLAVWAAWFAWGTVVVHERSDSARVEVDGAAQAIEAPVAARVASSTLALGQRVTAGQVLVELDSTAETLALGEAVQRRDAAAAQATYLRAELEVAEQAAQSNKSAAALGEARALAPPRRSRRT